MLFPSAISRANIDPKLYRALDNPLQTRPSGRMPHVLANAKEARDVANYLLQGIKANVMEGAGSTTFAYYEGAWDNCRHSRK